MYLSIHHAILYNHTFIQVVGMLLRSFGHFLRLLRFWCHPDWHSDMRIIKGFYFSFHGRSHHSGWPKCVTVLTHMESHWFRFPLHAGCGVECQQGSLATSTCLQPATICPSHLLAGQQEDVTENQELFLSGCYYMHYTCLENISLALRLKVFY